MEKCLDLIRVCICTQLKHALKTSMLNAIQNANILNDFATHNVYNRYTSITTIIYEYNHYAYICIKKLSLFANCNLMARDDDYLLSLLIIGESAR